MKQEVVREIFKSLIKANQEGIINDTIWSYSTPMETLWDYIMENLNMGEEEYQKFTQQVEKGV